MCFYFLLLLCTPSFAGQWAITLNGSTSVPGSSVTGNYTFANSQVTGPPPSSATSHIYFNISDGSCSLGLPGSLSVAATLTWTPDFPTDTSQPPPTLDLLETASASGSEWILQATGVNASASDGFSDPVTNPTAPVYGASSSGDHLYHLTISSGQTSVTLPARTLSASLSYATAITSSSASIGMGYSVQIDERAVTISADCDPTNKKVPLLDAVGNQTSDVNGDPNYTSTPNLPAYADIGIPYGEQHTVNVSDGIGGTISKLVVTSTSQTVTYRGHLLGKWATQNSQFWWNSSLKNYSFNGSLYHLFGLGLPTEAEIPVLTNVYVGPITDNDHGGTIIPNDAGSSGSLDHIFFAYQNGDNRSVYPAPQFATGNDGDGARATANYNLTLHQIYEKNYPDHVKRGIEHIRQAPNASYVRSTQNDSTLTVYAEKQDSWSIGVSVDGPEAAWMAKKLGLSLDASYSYSYNAGVQTSLQHVNIGYATYLEEFDAYKYHYGKGDVWGSTGYMGTGPYNIKEPDSPAGGYQAHAPAILLPAAGMH